MRMGIILQRRKRRQMRLIRQRLVIVMIVALMSAAVMSEDLRQKLRGAAEKSAQVFSSEQRAQIELTLPEKKVYALQLGVFDSGERAASEARRLEQAGVSCMVWQREKMRIVSDVASGREQLDFDSAKGQDAYVISDTLEEVCVRISADADAIEDVQALLSLPDSVLEQLLESGGEALSEVIQRTREQAQAAHTAHPENELYTQLAQSLLNWCTLMEQARMQTDARGAVSYAQVTMYALCYELRAAINRQASAESTASAQRTPSTAADVMPPA